MDYAPPRIFMDERVFSDILFQAMGTLEPKEMGVLAGERYEVNGENFINIVSSVTIDKKGDPFPFLFREEDYLEANGSPKLSVAPSVVVGWYRVGKGEGITDDEVVTHRGFFKFPWQLMLKVDQEKKEYSLYRAGEDGFELVDLLLYNDQFKGFFTGEALPEGNGDSTANLSEKYSGSIRRARRIIQELETQLGRKDDQVAAIRESVHSELSVKIGRLEDELKQERNKIQDLRSLVMRDADVSEAPTGKSRLRGGAPLPAWPKKVLAAVASFAILIMGVAVILSRPPTDIDGGLPTVGLINTGEDFAAVSPADADSPRKVKYTVKDGDNLWVISRKVLGDGSRFPEIAKENGLKGLKKLKPGSILTITVDK
ncbi:MAG: LysM domain-containing protein [Planctomycetota bacterium]|nr:LysM domain-containing protein [Planctomycetota bacterium]